MYTIQANPTATRVINITAEHLMTIERHQLFRDLVDSTGYIDEQVLEKLKLNIRAILETDDSDKKALLDLCLDVIYHQNMKAYGLQQLVDLYVRTRNNEVVLE